MKYLLLASVILVLSACVTDGDLGLVEVGPKKEVCLDTTRVIGTDHFIIQVDTVECDGSFGVRWKRL